MIVSQIESRYGMHNTTIIKRLQKHGLKKEAGHNYSADEIEQIIYSKHSQIHRKKAAISFTKEAIDIIHFFYTKKENSVPNISKALNIPMQMVQKVLNHYFEKRELTIESSLRFLDLAECEKSISESNYKPYNEI